MLRGCKYRERQIMNRRNLLKLSTLGGFASLMKMPSAKAQSQAKSRTRIVFLGTKGGPRVEVGVPIQPV